MAVLKMSIKRDIMKICLVFGLLGAVGLLGMVGLYFICPIIFTRHMTRTEEFLAQARRGQPIVRANEQYRNEVGQPPVAITNLVPKYLSRMPDVTDPQSQRSDGWDYVTKTNGTYTLRYYMGRGGVEYAPPDWYGNEEGIIEVILTNPQANK